MSKSSKVYRQAKWRAGSNGLTLSSKEQDGQQAMGMSCCYKGFTLQIFFLVHCITFCLKGRRWGLRGCVFKFCLCPFLSMVTLDTSITLWVLAKNQNDLSHCLMNFKERTCEARHSNYSILQSPSSEGPSLCGLSLGSQHTFLWLSVNTFLTVSWISHLHLHCQFWGKGAGCYSPPPWVPCWLHSTGVSWW